MKHSCGRDLVWQGTLTTGGLVCTHCARLEEPEPEPELPEGLFDRPDGTIWATCRSCEQDYELYCDVSEFDPQYSYCGGSDRCCP